MTTPMSAARTAAAARTPSTTPNTTASDSSLAARRLMSTGNARMEAGKWVASPTPARSSIRVWNATLSSVNRPARAKCRTDSARVARCAGPGRYAARRCGRRLTSRWYSCLAWFSAACRTVRNSSRSVAMDRC
uniref:Uncharacterized protein n=1 Tax=Zea mays TaxID=4577 RepID=C4J5L0_MAIZE|nr:unknown [Zea mays]